MAKKSLPQLNVPPKQRTRGGGYDEPASALKPIPTIRDVASLCRVSVATVSRALNQPSSVAEPTLKAVQQAASQLGFRLNRHGRHLRTTRSQTIGVVLPTLRHPVFAECLDSIEAAAHSTGYAVLINTTQYDPQREDEAIEKLLQLRVDGLILAVADAAHNKMLDKLDKEGVAYVLVYNQLSQRSKRVRRLTVSVDNQGAAADMTNYLLDLGHQHIVMLTGQFKQSDRARLRYEGYQQAMRGAGLPTYPALELPFMTADTRSALLDLVSSTQRPSALFCGSDQLAMQVVRDLRSLGLQVPHHISVAGFDGVQLGELMTPALSSIVQPSGQIGWHAFALLKSVIDAASPVKSLILPHTLRKAATAAALVTRATKVSLPVTKPQPRKGNHETS
jgi:DNA-binding LacI/PurR family transcriptional regulator